MACSKYHGSERLFSFGDEDSASLLMIFLGTLSTNLVLVACRWESPQLIMDPFQPCLIAAPDKQVAYYIEVCKPTKFLPNKSHSILNIQRPKINSCNQ